MAEKKSSFYIVEDPKFAKVLFNTTKLSWLWLIARIYIAAMWILPGWEKLRRPGLDGGWPSPQRILGILS